MATNSIIAVFSATVLLFSANISFAASSDDAKQSILSDIKTAQRTLNKTQNSISKEQATLAKQIFTKQQSLSKLRAQAAVNRRLADENTLSLDQLQTRLDTWQQQQQYQLNLLSRFVRQNTSNSAGNSAGNGSGNNNAANNQNELLSRVISQINNQEQALYPQFKKQSVVLSNGELSQANTLQVGPVAWFSTQTPKLMGLLNLDDESNALKVALVQSTNNDNPLDNTLNQNGAGSTLLTFDPSLTHLVTSQAQQESPLEHLEKGGLWAIPIILFACFALTIALLKAAQLLRLSKIKMHSQMQLQQFFKAENSNEFAGMQQQLFNLTLQSEKGQVRDDQLFNQLIHDKHKLDNFIGAIAVTAAVAPLLGLLGTVSGMIETFKMMTLFGSGDPEVVSGGIAQALITTELGLVVAIPALVLNALLSRKAKAYYSQLEGFALQLSQLEKGETNV
ncbi:MotA/TolQ/ExbB proton channel family protein [Pseudoalteromonas sp. NZS37]|uniref:MotA/TolQ/ExbB proton channel family protein n=1 Tax=Pseudoalteromonas sp. NZS37 TaxID=2792071 RepID=UPI0018CEAF78|nr:MotA/TolQ/ExbB proton channel family protein [Pseudoalteromonas sp. NZS37]MBG9989970.1 MotA/TolQ/ExbB proton channel family protein [Pseudoalteromonas sp. NZS37]